MSKNKKRGSKRESKRHSKKEKENKDWRSQSTESNKHLQSSEKSVGKSIHKPIVRRTIISFALVLGLLTVYYAVIGIVQVNYLVNEDLVFWLEPASKAYFINLNETVDYDIKLNTNNKWFCYSACEYSLNDVSSDKEITTGRVVLKPKESFEKKFSLTSPAYGEGQVIFRFEATCQNKRTFLCRSPGDVITRSSFVTMVYGPSDKERSEIDNIRIKLETFLKNLANSDSIIKSVKTVDFPVSFYWTDLQTEMKKLEDNLDDLISVSDSMRKLWNIQRYTELSNILNEDTIKKAYELNKTSDLLKKEIMKRQETHNKTLEKYYSIDIKKIYWIYNQSYILNKKTFTSRASDIQKKLGKIGNSIKKGEKSYDIQDAELNELRASLNLLEEDVQREISSLNQDLLFDILEEDRILCDIKGYCEPAPTRVLDTTSLCTEIDKYSDRFYKADRSFSEWAFRKYISATIPENFTTYELKTAVNDEFNITEWTKSQEYKSILENFVIEYLDEYRVPNINLTNTPIESLSPDVQQMILSMGVQAFDETPSKDVDACKRAQNSDLTSISTFLGTPYPEIKYVYLPWLSIKIPEIKSEINTNLVKHRPECCVFSECKPCCIGEECKNDENSYPVIYLHGHAFNKQTSPDYSLNVFDSLQKKMNDDGYINAGFYSLNTNPEKIGYGTYGFSGHPITLKASYYYDAFSENGKFVSFPEKSENIDVYAIRFKEIVDSVLYLTGKSKVNIVAHSMGGLVSRRYIQLFGEDKVDHLILIGTPNRGIEGKVATYCSVLGESSECNDMKKDSVFLKKLNNPDKQPKKVKIMTIAGSGCDMEGEDGDGIVRKASVPLEGADNRIVKGNCSDSTSTLHTQMLNINKYPLTYEYIKEGLIT